MFLLLEMVDNAASTPLLLGMPDSMGLLVFGVVLVSGAALLRRYMGPARNEDTDEKLGKNA